ncbi:MAG: carboxypeptidase-like regulatory domain-containing protein [Bacteroidetes bacterium]|nr:carboxypeptidase-like regulatory domain-containing protein [Bacteroidota bacterium]
MAEPSTHINYSFEDIQRYLQGKMSAAEMHTLEKAALLDPFLADAIEGFNEADLPTAQQHLNEINASLHKENKASKIVVFNKKTQWLNIAAIIILLAGIGILSAVFFNHDTKNSQVSTTKLAPVQNGIQSDTTAIAANIPGQNKIDSSSSLLAENKVEKTNKHTTIAKKTKTIRAGVQRDEEVNSEMDMLNTNDASEKNISAQSTAKLAKTMMTWDTASQSNNKLSNVLVTPIIFSGKVVDVNNKAIPGALIQSADKKNEVITDLDGNFYLKAIDTTLNVTASTVGYLQQSSKLKSGYNAPIILHTTTNSLNEVVTVGYGTVKNAKNDVLKNTRTALSDSTMPVGGWQNFNHYVLTQLNKDTLSEPEVYSNDLVELEFLVDNAGNPYNIKVVKPLDKTRNTKAIDILKNGPRWISTSNKKITKLAISF